METCDCCGMQFRSWPVNHPLHSTNWSMPDNSTADVCSEECKELVIEEYELERKVYARRVSSRMRSLRERLTEVKVALYDRDLDNISDGDLVDLFYDTRRMLDEEDG